MHARSRVVVAMIAALVLVGTSTATADVAAKEKKGTALVGLFKIDPADCATAEVSGSYLRLIFPGGTLEAGPFDPDLDSICADKTYSGITPGTDGGLRTGAYQPAPDPPFDEAGNGLGDKIITPFKFHFSNMGFATNKRGPSGTAYPAPKIVSSKQGELTGQMKALTPYFEGLVYEDNGSTVITGTYDKKSGAYTLELVSRITQGNAVGATSLIHLEGTFVKAKKK